jgi:hypothetical protein
MLRRDGVGLIITVKFQLFRRFNNDRHFGIMKKRKKEKENNIEKKNNPKRL